MRLRVIPGILFMLATFGSGAAAADDVQLTAKAVELMSRAKVASTIKGGPYNIRTEIDFRTTGMDGETGSGHYSRLHGSKGFVRMSVIWAGYSASMVGVNMSEARVGAWDSPPYPVRRLRELIPFSVGEFDRKDVVRAIHDEGARTCVLFETIEGESRNPGSICFNKLTGVMLSAEAGGATYEYTAYQQIAGALIPGHLEYREKEGFSLSADIVLTRVDTLPDDAFNFPPAATVVQLCRRATAPVPISVPPPQGGSGEGGRMSVVQVEAEISAAGLVTSAHAIHADRSELKEEAVKTVLNWRYEPGVCDGRPSAMTIDIDVRFQGR